MTRTLTLTLMAFWLTLGCASAPETRADQRSLEAQADATIDSMERKDPSLRSLLADAPGYVVFPEIGEGGFLVAGSSGVGVVFEDGVPIGYVELDGGSVGAQVGGQTYAQLVVFESTAALERLKADNFDLRADASATLIDSGAAAATQFESGAAIFVDDEAGLMVEASLGGQSLRFQPG